MLLCFNCVSIVKHLNSFELKKKTSNSAEPNVSILQSCMLADAILTKARFTSLHKSVLSYQHKQVKMVVLNFFCLSEDFLKNLFTTGFFLQLLSKPVNLSGRSESSRDTKKQPVAGTLAPPEIPPA